MSSQSRGPAYVLSIISGTLILLGGVFLAISAGILPSRAYGMGSKLVSEMLRSANLPLGTGFHEVSAIIGIVSGVMVLVGAVMIGSRREVYPAWGAVVLIFSALGLLGGGGFSIGSVLGIAGGILAITSKPLTSSA